MRSELQTNGRTSYLLSASTETRQDRAWESGTGVCAWPYRVPVGQRGVTLSAVNSQNHGFLLMMFTKNHQEFKKQNSHTIDPACTSHASLAFLSARTLGSDFVIGETGSRKQNAHYVLNVPKIQKWYFLFYIKLYSNLECEDLQWFQGVVLGLPIVCFFSLGSLLKHLQTQTAG